MTYKKFKKSTLPFLILFSFFLSACGGSSGSDNTPNNGTPSDPSNPDAPVTGEPRDARVINLTLDNPTIAPGQSTIVNVTVTYGESRVLAGGERVMVVVKLPPNVVYEGDSTGVTTENSSATSSPSVANCDDGFSFLAFDLGATELQNAADPDGREDADFNLLFSVNSPVPSGVNVVTAAAADNSLAFSCTGDFEEEASTGITVQ